MLASTKIDEKSFDDSQRSSPSSKFSVSRYSDTLASSRQNFTRVMASAICVKVQLELRASGLKKKEWGGLSKIDPYVLVYRMLGSDGGTSEKEQVLVHMTEVKQNEQDPMWDGFAFEYKVSQKEFKEGQRFRFVVMDKDKHSADDEVGVAQVSLADLEKNPTLSVLHVKKHHRHKITSYGSLLVQNCKVHQFCDPPVLSKAPGLVSTAMHDVPITRDGSRGSARARCAPDIDLLNLSSLPVTSDPVEIGLQSAPFKTQILKSAEDVLPCNETELSMPLNLNEREDASEVKLLSNAETTKDVGTKLQIKEEVGCSASGKPVSGSLIKSKDSDGTSLSRALGEERQNAEAAYSNSTVNVVPHPSQARTELLLHVTMSLGKEEASGSNATLKRVYLELRASGLKKRKWGGLEKVDPYVLVYQLPDRDVDSSESKRMLLHMTEAKQKEQDSAWVGFTFQSETFEGEFTDRTELEFVLMDKGKHSSDEKIGIAHASLAELECNPSLSVVQNKKHRNKGTSCGKPHVHSCHIFREEVPHVITSQAAELSNSLSKVQSQTPRLKISSAHDIKGAISSTSVTALGSTPATTSVVPNSMDSFVTKQHIERPNENIVEMSSVLFLVGCVSVIWNYIVSLFMKVFLSRRDGAPLLPKQD